MVSRYFLASLLAAASLASCSDSTEPISPPTEIRAVDGDGQLGTVGAPLDDPLDVRVLDSQGRAVEGVVVVFTASQGNLEAQQVASPPAAGASEAALASTAQDTTDVDGLARAVWTLGPTAGLQTVTASVEHLDPVEFSATADPGAPSVVVVSGGDGQLDMPGAMLAAPFAARVIDEYGNALVGLTVNWSVTAGGGNITAASGLTDGGGATTTTLTLGGSPGFNTVTASHAELDPVDFHALGVAQIWEDAVGDTFSSGTSASFVLPDLVQIGFAWDGDSLLVGLAFADSVVTRIDGGPNTINGIVDFDVDMNPLTGGQSAADEYRPGLGSTGIGVDVLVDMFADPSGDYIIYNASLTILGSTTPEIRGRLIGMYLPTSIIGGGPLALAVTAGTPADPTDIAPNDSCYVVDAASGL